MPLILKGFFLISLLFLVTSQPSNQSDLPKRQPESKTDDKNKSKPKQKVKPDPKDKGDEKYKTENQTDTKEQNKTDEKINDKNQNKTDNNQTDQSKQQKIPQKQNCQCLNSGTCYTLEQYDQNFNPIQKSYCNCSRSFIGTKCQQQAQEIMTTQELFKFINIYKYKYFYYEPKEQDMMSFTFHMCFDTRNYQNTSKIAELQNSVTFFLETQDENGNLNLIEQANIPTTVQIGQTQCKYVTIDYTLFTQTKLKTYQKLILALKLGKKLNQTTSSKNLQLQKPKEKNIQEKKIRSLYSLKYDIISVPNENNFSITNWTNNRTHSSISNTAKKNFTVNSFRRIYLNFIVSPFTVNQVFETIVYSLITLTAFIIVAVMIFILRVRILDVGITQSLSFNTGLSNDLSYFNIYMPSEQYIKDFDDQMRNHYHHQSDQECSICITNIQTGQMIRRTPCNHLFHTMCLDSWCAQNLTCPMCRRSLTATKIKQFYNSSQELRSNSDGSD